MNPKNQIQFYSWRYYLVFAFIVLVVAGLAARVFDLAILDQHFLRQQGDERVLRLVKTPPFRGMIVDRNGFPLAVSTTVYSVWVNPKEFSPDKEAIVEIGKLLEMKPKEISSLVNRYQKKKREFLYLKRGLSPVIAKQVKALGVTGLYTQEEYRRFYPEGEATAHVVGFTNVDDNGQEGLELAYNEWLQGEQGKKWVIKDRLGRVISEVRTVQEQKAGHDLMLSIDRRIQYLAYRELLNGVNENQARSGSVVVLDVKSGEILAMVNQPSFNPNSRGARKLDAMRNRSVTDTFEPGSTIKSFTILSAFETGKYKPDSVIDIAPGWLNVDRRLIREEHYKNPLLTVTEVLVRSSNVGAAKMVLSLPANHLWDLLHRVGFGEMTAVNFPGERSGSLIKHSPWGAFVLATYSFGYGMSVTPLQLAQAYAVIANHGIKLPVSLLHLEKPPAGEQVIDPKVTKEMIGLLEAVVTSKEGTGKKAQVPGYRVAGKTGTSRMLGAGGYQSDRHISSFVGMAPATNPRFVVAVVISDPRGKQYYGGDVAGPVFEKIMEGALRIYAVPPDELQA